VATLGWFLAAGLLAALLALPGLAGASLLPRRLAPAEELLVALAISLAAPAMLALVLLPLPVPYPLAAPPIAVALLAASGARLWWRRAWLQGLARDPQVRLLAGCVAAGFLAALVVGALPWDTAGVGNAGRVDSFHVPLMPGDSYLQYRTAQIIQNRLPVETTPFYANYWSISDRTPLVGLVTTFCVSAAGIQLPSAPLYDLAVPYTLLDGYGYWLYRQLSMLSNAFVLAPAGLLAWRLLGPRTAKLGLLICLLSPYLLINLLFHWPKLLVGFFVLGFYLWTLVRPRPALAGAFAAGGVLSHPVGALFLPGVFLYQLLARRWRQLGLAAGLAVLLCLPWFFWTGAVYHHPSRMLTYPIGHSIDDPTHAAAEAAAAWQAFSHRPPASILGDRWVVFRDTFFTWPIPAELAAARSLKDAHWPVFEIFRTSFPGIFGLPLAVFGFLSWLRVLRSARWVAMLGAPVVAILLFWGVFPRAVAQEAFQPAAALWICLAVAVLLRGPTWLVRLVLALTALELLAFVYVALLKVPPPAGWRPEEAVLVLLSLAGTAAALGLGWRWASEPDAAPGDAPEVDDLAPVQLEVPVGAVRGRHH